MPWIRFNFTFSQLLAAGLFALTLSGCKSTAEQETATTLNEEQVVPDCQLSQGESINPCSSEQEGVIAVTHPAEDVELPLSSNEPVVAPIQDVWQRVRQQLTFSIPDNKRIESQRRWYLKHPEYLKRVSKRAEPFLFHIVEKIEQRQMPLELALLPIVESAFDPFAYSHGRAAGMWQFIPGTANRFGLKQGWWYDGRRDVLASTDAALDYLTYLLKFFDGDWLHALAAYNSGEGRVRRAIKNNKRKGKPTDFWALDLPRETRAYVPKLLALADILRNHQEVADSWHAIDNQPLTQVVSIGGQIDLAKAANIAGLTLKELHALNPGFNRWATDPDGPHKLLIPIDRAEQFSETLASMPAKERLNWVRHQVKRGDSLLKLANDYHTTVDVIREVNELDGNMIVAGKHLVIPVSLQSLDSYSLSQDQRLLATQEKQRARYQLTHTVVSGDNFWDLSRHYKVKLRSLAKWNGMAPTDPLQLGQKLVIWKDKVSDQQAQNAIMRSVIYTVRSGDSLARIANRFKVRIADLRKWNQLQGQKYLQPGQKLKVFVDVTRT